MPNSLHDLSHGTFLIAPLAPNAATAGGVASPVDMADTDGPCFAIQAVGQLAGSAWHGRFQESGDGQAWTDIPGGAFADVSGGDDIQIISFARTGRFLQYVYAFDQGAAATCFALAALGAQRKLVG